MTNRVLIAEGDPQSPSQPPEVADLAELAARFGEEILRARTAEGALQALERDPYLVLIDGGLRDGAALRIAAAAARRLPAPIVVVLGVDDTPEQSFRLHELGVRGYVSKRAPREAVEREIERALTLPPNLTAFAVAAVGKAPMQSVIREVRRTMLDQALGLSRGSRSGAARLLAISRQAVQQIVREREQRGPRRCATALPNTVLPDPRPRDAEVLGRPVWDQISSRPSSSATV